MSASDVAVLELVWELCGSADAAGAVRVPKSKNASPWPMESGRWAAKTLEYCGTNQKKASAGAQRTVYLLPALDGLPATRQRSNLHLHWLQHKR